MINFLRSSLTEPPGVGPIDPIRPYLDTHV